MKIVLVLIWFILGLASLPLVQKYGNHKPISYVGAAAIVIAGPCFIPFVLIKHFDKCLLNCETE